MGKGGAKKKNLWGRRDLWGNGEKEEVGKSDKNFTETNALTDKHPAGTMTAAQKGNRNIEL